MSTFQLYEGDSIGADNPQSENGAHGETVTEEWAIDGSESYRAKVFRAVNEGAIVRVRIVDMAHYEQQLPDDFDFDLAELIVIGQVVRRRNRALIIAHQVQPNDEQVRNVTAIPWECILEMDVWKHGFSS